MTVSADDQPPPRPGSENTELITATSDYTIAQGQVVSLTIPDAHDFYTAIHFEPTFAGLSLWNFGEISLSSAFKNTNVTALLDDGGVPLPPARSWRITDSFK
jgi:hypothetical protein